MDELKLKLNEKEKKACLKALELADLEPTEENLEHYCNVDYLTINKARSGELYAWYSDESYNVAININTLEQLSQEEIEEQFL